MKTTSFLARPRLFIKIAAIAAGSALAGAAALATYVAVAVLPDLPPLDALTDYRPRLPLRVYTADNVLIGEFGVERREFVPIASMPPVLRNAVLAIEDSRFYEHGGVDWRGAVRAVAVNTLRGRRAQGASTITMQVARTFLLTREKAFLRKLDEVALTYRIEERLSKDRILELYMNEINLGNRSYGFASAAQTYFGKTLQQLTLAEAAMLAGLPQSPEKANPIANRERAVRRQHAVLARMRDLGHIDEAQYAAALKEELRIRPRGSRFSSHADFAAEMVRQAVYAQYKDATYTRGLNVYTTLDSRQQEAAWRGLRRQVLDYEARHGYRGPEKRIALPRDEAERDEAIDDALDDVPFAIDLEPAVVLEASPQAVRVQLASGERTEIRGDGLRLVAAALKPGAADKLKLSPGAVVRVRRDERAPAGKPRWMLTQLPQVQAAMVVVDARDGAYRALVGGFDYHLAKFNHVTQAWRQPGSSIKPFVYSAALEKGLSPATLVNDTPFTVPAAVTGSQDWSPRNDNGYDGPVTMRAALARSKNVCSVRILQEVGPVEARDYLARFGFDPARHPANLTMVLGSGAATPAQLAAGYAVFANGGFRIEPYLIQRITDARGTVLAEASPRRAGEESERVLDERNAFVIDSMLREVVRAGTGAAAAQQLGRGDLAGKTGTTSDAFDGWFAGYAGNLVGVAWMGYDEPRSLGGREFGATLALPIWIETMRAALAGKPEYHRPVPAGLVQANGDWVYEEFAGQGGIAAIGFDGEPGALPVAAPADHQQGAAPAQGTQQQ